MWVRSSPAHYSNQLGIKSRCRCQECQVVNFNNLVDAYNDSKTPPKGMVLVKSPLIFLIGSKTKSKENEAKTTPRKYVEVDESKIVVISR